jgi:adenylylsulfate kinase
MGRDVEAVAITGTIGVGKTALAAALSERLHAKGIRHALIEIDWLGEVYPPPNPDEPYSLELAFKNLKAIAPNLIEAGAEFLVIGATLTAKPELDGLRRALGEIPITVCRVQASPETIAERIRQRELGYLLDDFLNRTDALAQEIEEAGIDDFVVTNDNRSIAEVAAELLEKLGWEWR